MGNLDLFYSNLNLPPLKVVSHGIGQDSTFETERILNSDIYREKNYRNKDVIFAFSDTGKEKEESYKNLEKQYRRVREFGYDFFVLNRQSGYHSESWATLEVQMLKNSTLVMPGKKSCTDNLKVKPIYRFINAYCKSKIEKTAIRFNRLDNIDKPWIKKYVELSGQKIEVFIGFSKGEENRAYKTLMFQAQKSTPEWMRDCIEYKFHLIEDGVTREDCIEYFDRSGYGPVSPSNCVWCPYQSKAEIVYNVRKRRSEMNRLYIHEIRKWEKDISVHGERKNGAFSRVAGESIV
ncbi:hypothetical protein ABMA71_16480, partial [Halobacteriovorax sp. ZH3_bin.1]